MVNESIFERAKQEGNPGNNNLIFDSLFAELKEPVFRVLKSWQKEAIDDPICTNLTVRKFRSII